MISRWFIGSVLLLTACGGIGTQNLRSKSTDKDSGDSFSLVALSVTSLSLINADSDTVIPGFDNFANGAVLDLRTLPTRNLNVRANVAGTVKSVSFDYDGKLNYRTEGGAPYALFGDSTGNYAAGTFAVGQHNIGATAYELAARGGAKSPLYSVTFTVVDGATPPPPPPSGLRIAYSSDGNMHDKDDFGASALGLALIASQNMQARVVHYDFNSHFPDSLDAWEKQMDTSVMGSVSRFSFGAAKFYDDQTEATAAVANLAAEISASTSTNRLKLVVAGPFEIVYRAFSKSDRTKHQFVDIITHSPWNNDHGSDGTHVGTHNLGDLQASFPGFKVIQIANQNRLLNTKPDWAPWYWLRDSSNANLRWVYTRIQAVGRPDPSDAGMLYFLLFNDQNATPDKFRSKIVPAFQ